MIWVMSEDIGRTSHFLSYQVQLFPPFAILLCCKFETDEVDRGKVMVRASAMIKVVVNNNEVDVSKLKRRGVWI